MIALCKKCEAQLLAEVSKTQGADISGFWCSHNRVVALTISQDGSVLYSQLSGPVDADSAATLMAEFAREIHAPLTAGLPSPSEAEVRH